MLYIYILYIYIIYIYYVYSVFPSGGTGGIPPTTHKIGLSHHVPLTVLLPKC